MTPVNTQNLFLFRKPSDDLAFTSRLIDHTHGDRPSVQVEVTTLDQYFTDWKGPKIDLIKCDVEGNELEVFKGAKNKLLEDGPTLIFECHHEEGEKGELFSFLVSLGYEGFFFSDGFLNRKRF